MRCLEETTVRRSLKESSTREDCTSWCGTTLHSYRFIKKNLGTGIVLDSYFEGDFETEVEPGSRGRRNRTRLTVEGTEKTRRRGTEGP